MGQRSLDRPPVTPLADRDRSRGVSIASGSPGYAMTSRRSSPQGIAAILNENPPARFSTKSENSSLSFQGGARSKPDAARFELRSPRPMSRRRRSIEAERRSPAAGSVSNLYERRLREASRRPTFRKRRSKHTWRGTTQRERRPNPRWVDGSQTTYLENQNERLALPRYVEATQTKRTSLGARREGIETNDQKPPPKPSSMPKFRSVFPPSSPASSAWRRASCRR